jgi:hypothetical protein
MNRCSILLEKIRLYPASENILLSSGTSFPLKGVYTPCCSFLDWYPKIAISCIPCFQKQSIVESIHGMKLQHRHTLLLLPFLVGRSSLPTQAFFPHAPVENVKTKYLLSLKAKNFPISIEIFLAKALSVCLVNFVQKRHFSN